MGKQIADTRANGQAAFGASCEVSFLILSSISKTFELH